LVLEVTMRLAHGLAALGLMLLGFGCSASDSGSGAGSGKGGGGGNANTGANGGGGGVITTGGTGGLASGGGGTGAAAGDCAGLKKEASESVLPADVIWAIDTSGSMLEETAAVRQNMNAFSQQITNAGVDVRIVLIAEQYSPPVFPGFPDDGICIDAPLGSGNCPNDTNLPKFAHIYKTVSSTNALDMFLGTYDLWKSQLRDNALKIFVVVTDDNSSLPAAQFTDQINVIDPSKISPHQWRFYGIYCFTKCPSAAKPGTVYAELVQQTQGVAGDLCLQNFQPVFDQLATGIVGATKLDCGWEIPPPPAGQSFDQNLVNVEYTSGTSSPTTIGKVPSAAECGPQGGWYYDNDVSPNNILLCPATCDAIQSDPNDKQIEVKFGCVTVQVPS
jgi:hypothetical protein